MASHLCSENENPQKPQSRAKGGLPQAPGIEGLRARAGQHAAANPSAGAAGRLQPLPATAQGKGERHSQSVAVDVSDVAGTVAMTRGGNAVAAGGADPDLDTADTVVMLQSQSPALTGASGLKATPAESSENTVSIRRKPLGAPPKLFGLKAKGLGAKLGGPARRVVRGDEEEEPASDEKPAGDATTTNSETAAPSAQANTAVVPESATTVATAAVPPAAAPAVAPLGTTTTSTSASCMEVPRPAPVTTPACIEPAVLPLEAAGDSSCDDTIRRPELQCAPLSAIVEESSSSASSSPSDDASDGSQSIASASTVRVAALQMPAETPRRAVLPATAFSTPAAHRPSADASLPSTPCAETGTAAPSFTIFDGMTPAASSSEAPPSATRTTVPRAAIATPAAHTAGSATASTPAATFKAAVPLVAGLTAQPVGRGTPAAGAPVISTPARPPNTPALADRKEVFVNQVPYTVLELLGKGGTSQVFRVLSPEGSMYALKVVRLDSEPSESEALQEAVENEIQLMTHFREQGVTDKHIIKLVDSEVVAQQVVYMVMECGDIDFAGMLKRQLEERQAKLAAGEAEGFNENFVRMYWEQMLRAVEAMHKARVIHGDLKPMNFLCVRGALKLIDFGIAKSFKDEVETKIARECASAPSAPCAHPMHVRTRTSAHALMRASACSRSVRWSVRCSRARARLLSHRASVAMRSPLPLLTRRVDAECLSLAAIRWGRSTTCLPRRLQALMRRGYSSRVAPQTYGHLGASSTRWYTARRRFRTTAR